MAIYNPGKYYIISVDEIENVCCISPFDVEKIEQSLGDVYNLETYFPAKTITKVTGHLYGTMQVLKPRELDFNDISYEEITELVKE